ncbi:MAG: M14 family metallocarboxypeptidase [Verrucomicrobiaceae bacterium]|nr:M14 family metallocarboxypeptidase [Verrucomicrobiaceae bacterium]
MKLLPGHRCHDYADLCRRWKLATANLGWKMRKLCVAGGDPIWWIESSRAAAGEPAFYVSAGVHGDEPGATEGLLRWVCQSGKKLADAAVVLFPCLNPTGLRNNTRVDYRGLDLNRQFQSLEDEVCVAWRKIVTPRTFSLCLTLHEDYDAQGAYVYDLSNLSQVFSRELLTTLPKRMPIDARPKIDGRAAREGVIHRKMAPHIAEGMPEAIVLYQLGCPAAWTFETPSEFSLADRAEAQAAFVSGAFKLAPAILNPGSAR